MYVWPYFAETDLSGSRPPKRSSFTASCRRAGRPMKKSGKYGYYRLGIAPTGSGTISFSSLCPRQSLAEADRRAPASPSSPSHMASRPRTSVPFGQPRTRAPGERGPAAFAADPRILDHALCLEIDDGEVGVVAHGDAPLAGDAEDALRACAGQIDETGEREAPGIDMVEHHRDERLHARHARRRRGIVLGSSLRAYAARGRSRAHRRRRVRRPTTALLVVAVAERRVHLRFRAETARRPPVRQG